MVAVLARSVFAAALLVSLTLVSCSNGNYLRFDGIVDASDAPAAGFDCTTDDCEAPPVCPPPGPYGYKQGDQLTNQQFTLQDDSPFELHDLCGVPAALLFNFYGW